MLLLYIIFDVVPLVIFLFFAYNNVKQMQNHKNKYAQFFMSLRMGHPTHDVYTDFSNRYIIEKYRIFLKVKKGIDANFNMEIVNMLNEDNRNEKKEEHDIYISDLLNTIYDDDEFEEACLQNIQGDNWIRKISNEDMIKLKVLLMKKAICLIPILSRIMQNKNIKHKLYNSYYIDDVISRQYDEHCDSVMQDLSDITIEANCLEDNWGEKIVNEAYKISQYNKMKAQAEKKKKEEMKNLMKKQKQKEKKIKDAQEKAELLVDEFLKEENMKKRKKKKGQNRNDFSNEETTERLNTQVNA